MSRIEKPALVAATIGPIQSVAGWAIAGALWEGYDPIRKTISDLAANDSPVQLLMSSFFILGGTLSLVAAVYAKAFAMPGRVMIFLAGIATYGFTIFATPSQDSYSTPHRIFASIAFVLMAAWPLFSMRRDKSFPWIIRPVGAILSTLFMTVLAVWFLLSWLDPTFTAVGLAERVMAVAQVWYMAFVIWVVYLHQQRQSKETESQV
jgi:hypothetical membrane protein